MTYAQFIGKRTDFDLRTKWWHRLLGVVYACLLVSVAALVLTLAWSTEPEATLSNVSVGTSLAEVLERVDPADNAAAALASRQGHTGIRRASGEISSLSRDALAESFCTKTPLQAAEGIAAFFNKRAHSAKHTAASVRADFLKDGNNPGPTCWFSSAINDALIHASWSDVIDYEFTPTAKLKARWAAVGKVFAVLLLVHVALAQLYYRGLVYIICGPRKKLAT